MDSNWQLMKDGQPQTPTIGAWLAQQFPDGGNRIGVDASIVSSRAWCPMSAALDESGNQLVAVEGNLVDQIWADQPPQTSNSIITLSTKITGKTVADKLAEIRREMVEAHAEVLVITALDEVACELNRIRFIVKFIKCIQLCVIMKMVLIFSRAAQHARIRHRLQPRFLWLRSRYGF